jgi:hypothetical protein
MAGGLLQLIANGSQDILLTQNPELTFFKTVYRRYNNFSIDTKIVKIKKPKFNSRVDMEIPKIGDLISNIMLKIDIPYISAKYNLEIKEQIKNILELNKTKIIDESIYNENENLIEIIKVLINFVLNEKLYKNNYYLLDIDNEYKNIYQLIHHAEILDTELNLKEINIYNENIYKYIFNNEEYNKDLNNNIINDNFNEVKQKINFNDYQLNLSNINNLQDLNILVGQFLMYDDIYEVLNILINYYKNKELDYDFKLYTIHDMILRFQNYITNKLILDNSINNFYKITNDNLKHSELKNNTNKNSIYCDFVIDNTKVTKEEIINDPFSSTLPDGTVILSGSNIFFIYKNDLITNEIIFLLEKSDLYNNNFIFIRDKLNINLVAKYGIKKQEVVYYYENNNTLGEQIEGIFLIVKFIESISGNFNITNIETYKENSDGINLELSEEENFENINSPDLIYNFKYNNDIEGIYYNQHGYVIFYDNKNFINNTKLLTNRYEDIFNYKLEVESEDFDRLLNNLEVFYEILLVDNNLNEIYELFNNYKNNITKVYLTSKNDSISFLNNKNFYSEYKVIECKKDIINNDNLYFVSDDKYIEYKIPHNQVKNINTEIQDIFNKGDNVKVYLINDPTIYYDGKIITIFSSFDNNGIPVYSNYKYNIKFNQGQKIYPEKLLSIKVVLFNNSLNEKINDNNKNTYYEFNDKLDIKSSFYLTKEGKYFNQVLKYSENNDYCISDDIFVNLKINVKMKYFPEDINSNKKKVHITIKNNNKYETIEDLNNREIIEPISLNEIKIGNLLKNNVTNESFEITNILESLYISDSIKNFNTDYLNSEFITKIIGLIELNYDEKIIKIEVKDDLSNWFLKEEDILYIYNTNEITFNPLGCFKILWISIDKKYYILKMIIFDKLIIDENDNENKIIAAQNTLAARTDNIGNLVLEDISYFEFIRKITYKHNSVYSTYKYIDTKNTEYLNNLGTLEYNELIKRNLNNSIKNNVLLFRNIITSLFKDENNNSKVNHVFRSYDYNINTNNFDGSKNEIIVDNNLFNSYYRSFFRGINDNFLDNYDINKDIYPSFDLLQENLNDYKNYFLSTVLDYSNKRFLEKTNFGVNTSYNSVGEIVKKIDFLKNNKILLNINIFNKKIDNSDQFEDFNYNVDDILNVYNESDEQKDMFLTIKEITTLFMDINGINQKITKLKVDYVNNYSYEDQEIINVTYFIGKDVLNKTRVMKVYNTSLFKIEEYSYKFNDNIDANYNESISNHNVNFIGNHTVNYLLLDFIITLYNILYIDEKSLFSTTLINMWNTVIFSSCYYLYDYVFNLLNNDKFISTTETIKCNLVFVYDYENLINESIISSQILNYSDFLFEILQEMDADILILLFGQNFSNLVSEDDSTNLLEECLKILLQSKNIDDVFYTIDLLQGLDLYITNFGENKITLSSLFFSYLNSELNEYDNYNFIKIFHDHSNKYYELIHNILNIKSNFNRSENYIDNIGHDNLHFIDFCIENNLFNFYDIVLNNYDWIESNISNYILPNLDKFFVIFTNYSNYYKNKNFLIYDDNKNLLKISGFNYNKIKNNSNDDIINILIDELHNNYNVINQKNNGNYFESTNNLIKSINTKNNYIYKDIDMLSEAINYTNIQIQGYTVLNLYNKINNNDKFYIFYNKFQIIKMFEKIFPKNFKNLIDNTNIIQYIKNKINLINDDDSNFINQNIDLWLDEIKEFNNEIEYEEYFYYKNELILKKDYINIKNIIEIIDNESNEEQNIRENIETIKEEIHLFIFELFNDIDNNLNNNIKLLEDKISSKYINYKLFKYCILTLDEFNIINNKNEGKCIVKEIDSIGRIKSVLITDGGYNFEQNDIVCLSYGNGFGAIGKVKEVNLLEILELEITDPGEGYELDDNLVIELFELPETLKYYDNSFLRIVRKTDLPDNYIYNKNTNTIENLNFYNNEYDFLYNSTFFLKKYISDNNNIDDFIYQKTGNITVIREYTNNNFSLLTSENHNLSIGQFILIDDSINYNGSYIVHDIIDSNNFLINIKFIENEENINWKSGIENILKNKKYIKYFNIYNSINTMLTQTDFLKEILSTYNEEYIYDIGLEYSDLTKRNYYNLILKDILKNYYMIKNKNVIQKINENILLNYDSSQLYLYNDIRYEKDILVNNISITNSVEVNKIQDYLIINTNSVPNYNINKYYNFNNNLIIYDTNPSYFISGRNNIITSYPNTNFAIPLHQIDAIEKERGIFWSEGDINYSKSKDPMLNNIIIGVSINGVLLTSNKDINNLKYDIYGGCVFNNIYQYNKFPSFMCEYSKLIDNQIDINNSYIYEHNVIDIINEKLNLTGNEGHSSIIGYALDGYPIYGPIGFLDDELNNVKLMKSSYIKDPNGNYKFIKNYGDLDICNGIFSPTPEYPSGIYHYHMTIEIDLNGRPKEKILYNYPLEHILSDTIIPKSVIPAYPYIIGNFRGIPKFTIKEEEINNNIIIDYNIYKFIKTNDQYFNQSLNISDILNIDDDVGDIEYESKNILNKIELYKKNEEINYQNYQTIIPEINKTKSRDKGSSANFAWIKRLGHFITNSIDISIDSQIIDKIDSHRINIISELFNIEGQKRGYANMIGNINQLNNFDKNPKPKYSMYIPLPFWFNKRSGLSIPIISLTNSILKIGINFNKFNDCVFVDDYVSYTNNIKLNGELLIDYIYLDESEREIFAKSKHEYLIEQNQIYENYINTTDIEIPIKFNNCVKDINWVVQKTSFVNNKVYHNYGMTDIDDENNGNPVKEAIIKFNGLDRFRKMSGNYFNYVVPFEKYISTPRDGINCYSFSLKPYNFQPTGSCNFSFLEDQKLCITLNDNYLSNNETAIIRVYARSYNILRFMSGIAGLAFYK